METFKYNNFSKNVTGAVTAKAPTIVFYSPDLDFCISLRLLFQDQYNMVTITDPRMLLMTVRDLGADLVIVDSLPTEKMRHRFEIMKRENSQLRILSFYASSFDDKKMHKLIRSSVDAAFSKPIDLAEVTESIHELMMHGPEQAHA